MNNFSAEMIEKAKTAKNAEELLALAKENNVEMTADEATIYFAQLNPKSGELGDDDLSAVAGGGCTIREVGQKVQITSGESCPNCGSTIGTTRMGTPYGGPEIYCDNCGTLMGYTRQCKYVEL